MSDATWGRQSSASPGFVAALVAALALHVGLVILMAQAPDKPPKLRPIGSSVPINIVSKDQITDARAAEQAPVTQTATTPVPAPVAPPAPPPAPAPIAAKPAPPKPTAAVAAPPKPSPKPVKPPPPVAARPAPPRADLLDTLQNAINHAAASAPPRPIHAPPGPPRRETAPQARPSMGEGISQSDLLGLQQLLERLWNPNCAAPGAEGVRLRLAFTIGVDGNVVGQINVAGSSDPVVAAATRQAVDAVRRAEPYAEPYYGQRVVVNFNAREACAKRGGG